MGEPKEQLFVVKWNKNDYNIFLDENQTIQDLKSELFIRTEVRCERQKLSGLKLKPNSPIKTISDQTLISQLQIPSSSSSSSSSSGDDLIIHKIMLIGTPEKDIISTIQEKEELLNDFNFNEEEEISIPNKPENLRKVANRLKNFKVKIINEPRPGKKCLVLDVDYTLFDHRSSVETPTELMRPYLHEFLTECYLEYDIVIWSATSYKWIELKMKELGVLSNPNYKIAFFLDCDAMITVVSPRYGVFNTKPLPVLWGFFPNFYSKENTIHIDDLGRNFIMNPENGLKIKPFKNGPIARFTDNELQKLAKYLTKISLEKDFSKLKHKHWEDHI